MDRTNTTGTRKARIWLTVVTALLMVLAAACGGADEPTDTAGDDGGDATETTAAQGAETTAAQAEGEEEGGDDGSGGDDLAADDLPTFRIANQESLFSIQSAVAKSEGYFEETGVNVEHSYNSSGGERATLVIGDNADGSILGGASVQRGFVSGDWKVVGSHVQAGNANALSCDPSLGIESGADLKGKGLTIAAADGSGTYITWQAIIAPALGLEEGDWELVNLPTADRLSAVAGGSADCMLQQEPINTIAASEGLSEVVEDTIFGNFDPNHQFLYVANRFLEQEGGEEAVKRYLEALVMAADFIEENPEETANIYIETMLEQGADIEDDADLILVGVESQDYQVCLGEAGRENLAFWQEVAFGPGGEFEGQEPPSLDENVLWDLNEEATGGC